MKVRDPLYNIMPLVHNTLSYTSKFKRVNLMLNAHSTKQTNKINKQDQSNTRILWEILNMLIILIVVMVSQVSTYANS